MVYQGNKTAMYCMPNRLIRTKRGNVKFEAAYGYMDRRFEKTLYGGYKLIGVYDALNNGREGTLLCLAAESAGLDVPLSRKHDGAAHRFLTYEKNSRYLKNMARVLQNDTYSR